MILWGRGKDIRDCGLIEALDLNRIIIIYSGPAAVTVGLL